MRIAYVEDNATNQALVERVARMTQHMIVPYSEGEIALDALRTESFDLIMMDIELAGKVNGLDVVRALREAGMTTPIIAVTAYAMKGDRDRCLEAGCNDYLPKPIPIKDLLELLNRYEARFKAAAEVAPPAPQAAAPDVPVTPPAAPVPAPQGTAPAAPPVTPVPAPTSEVVPVLAAPTPDPAPVPPSPEAAKSDVPVTPPVTAAPAPEPVIVPPTPVAPAPVSAAPVVPVTPTIAADTTPVKAETPPEPAEPIAPAAHAVPDAVADGSAPAAPAATTA